MMFSERTGDVCFCQFSTIHKNDQGVDFDLQMRLDFSCIGNQDQYNQTVHQQKQLHIGAMLKSERSNQELTLKHDLNRVLSIFNELDSNNQGFVTFNELERLLNKLAVNLTQFYSLGFQENGTTRFQFDDILSVLGILEVPEQQSAYVLAFVKMLAQFRNKCIESCDSDNGKGLNEAKDIIDRIKQITKNQLERRKLRLLDEHDKIFEQMNRTQNNQFQSFEEEWKKYLGEFKTQTHEKMEKVKSEKIKQLSLQSSKLVQTARRNSLVTSTKLRELVEKKKWLVKEGKFSDAIQINYLIDGERKKIEEQKEESLDYTLRKRVQSMKKKNESAMNYIQASMSVNMNKLLAKKKEGEHLMQLRMKNLRQEAEKKLNDHLRSELGRLKALFARASR